MRILSHAEDAECAEARIVSLACGLRRGLVFLTTDFTDYTDSSLTEWICAWPPGWLLCYPRMVTNLFLSTDDTDDTVFLLRGTIASVTRDYPFHLWNLLIFFDYGFHGFFSRSGFVLGLRMWSKARWPT